MSPVEPCSCAMAGFCERHHLNKSRSHWLLCQNDEEQRAFWDKTTEARRHPPTKLGDRTESLLKKIGITQDRYKEVKARFGLAPDCSCDARKQWLNNVGEYFGVGR